MKSRDELKEVDIKNHACYYFDDIIRDFDINFDDISLDDFIRHFMTFHTKPRWVQNHYVLGSIR